MDVAYNTKNYEHLADYLFIPGVSKVQPKHANVNQFIIQIDFSKKPVTTFGHINEVIGEHFECMSSLSTSPEIAYQRECNALQ